MKPRHSTMVGWVLLTAATVAMAQSNPADVEAIRLPMSKETGYYAFQETVGGVTVVAGGQLAGLSEGQPYIPIQIAVAVQPGKGPEIEITRLCFELHDAYGKVYETVPVEKVQQGINQWVRPWVKTNPLNLGQQFDTFKEVESDFYPLNQGGLIGLHLDRESFFTDVVYFPAPEDLHGELMLSFFAKGMTEGAVNVRFKVMRKKKEQDTEERAKKKKKKDVGAGSLVQSTAWSGQAKQDPSGFMEDYSLLQPAKGDGSHLVYLPPGVDEKFSHYRKIMIDQPEILLAPDSPYKGMKPDQAKALADGFRKTLRESFGRQFEVVEEPGAGVLYLRVGLTNLFLKRKVKFYNFTPVGAVGLGLKTALVDNVAKKFSLTEVVVEAEYYDSKTKELIAAGVEQMGHAKDKQAGIKKDPTSWKELEAVLEHMVDRVICRVENSRVPEAKRKNCG